MYLEADRQHQRTPLKWWLRDAGFQIWEHTPPLWNDDNCRGATDCPWGSKDIVSINWLCLPDDRQPPAVDFLTPLL
jgi:hypothetical protein